VCTGVATTTLDIAEGLMAALGIEVELKYGPRRPGDIERSVLDDTEMRRQIGEPLALSEGLAATAAWFRDHAQ
jgi:nucleoside-diphosphate-sugar epimerase